MKTDTKQSRALSKQSPQVSEERERADAAEEEGREVIERYRQSFGERGVEAPVWCPTLAD